MTAPMSESQELATLCDSIQEVGEAISRDPHLRSLAAQYVGAVEAIEAGLPRSVFLAEAGKSYTSAESAAAEALKITPMTNAESERTAISRLASAAHHAAKSMTVTQFMLLARGEYEKALGTSVLDKNAAQA